MDSWLIAYAWTRYNDGQGYRFGNLAIKADDPVDEFRKMMLQHRSEEHYVFISATKISEEILLNWVA